MQHGTGNRDNERTEKRLENVADGIARRGLNNYKLLTIGCMPIAHPRTSFQSLAVLRGRAFGSDPGERAEESFQVRKSLA
jgi:hypothetical protein